MTDKNQTNIFELASRLGLQFSTPDSPFSFTVSALWKLPLNNANANQDLYRLATHYYTLLTKDEDKDVPVFLQGTIKKDETVQLQVDILSHIITTLTEEKNEKEESMVRAQQRKKIEAIIAEKSEEDLRSKSKEELLELHGKLS